MDALTSGAGGSVAPVLSFGGTGPLVHDVRGTIQQIMKFYADMLEFHQLYFVQNPVALELLAYCENRVRTAVDDGEPRCGDGPHSAAPRADPWLLAPCVSHGRQRCSRTGCSGL